MQAKLGIRQNTVNLSAYQPQPPHPAAQQRTATPIHATAQTSQTHRRMLRVFAHPDDAHANTSNHARMRNHT